MSEQNQYFYEFGPFRVDTRKRLLWRDSEIVPLKPKAFETLLALIEHSGRVLEKDELMRRVWPDSVVEEGNLTFNISSLRKALGDDPRRHQYIVTIPGEGYQFVAGVRATFDELEVRERTRITIEEEETNVNDETAQRPEPVVNNGHPQDVAQSNLRTIHDPVSFATHLGRQHATAAPSLRDRWKLISVATLAGIVLIAVASFGIRQARQGKDHGGNNPAGAPLSFQPPTLLRFPTTGHPLSAAVSPDGKSIAFAETDETGQSLWLGQIQSRSGVMIRPPAAVSYGTPVFSPDGNYIYLTIEDEHHSRPTLAKISTLGGAMIEVLEDVDSPVSFSPDGRRIAFLRREKESEGNSIFIANSQDGSEQRRLATRKLYAERFSSYGLAWSPDGKTLTVGVLTDPAGIMDKLYNVDVADGSQRPFSETEWRYIHRLTWLTDGSGLLLIGVREYSPSTNNLPAPSALLQVWFVAKDGEARRITNDLIPYHPGILSASADARILAALQSQFDTSIWVAPEGDASKARQITAGAYGRQEGRFGLSWTPTGRIVYGAWKGDDSETIWEMAADGSNQRQLTPDGLTESLPLVTSDGRYIVFHSDRVGTFEIWRTNIDGSHPLQLTSGGNNYQPAVTPDGRWVYYRSLKTGNGTLWRVSIDGGQAQQFTDQIAGWPVVSPDGKYVACAYRESKISDKMVLAVLTIDNRALYRLFKIPESATLWNSIRWSPDGKSLMYRDGRKGLWQQSLDSDTPQPVKGFENLDVQNFAWSLDGKQMAFASGSSMREIILIENFR